MNVFVADALNRLAIGATSRNAGDAVSLSRVANPPYMGSKFHIPALKQFLKDQFPDAKNDLFACFIERGYAWRLGRQSLRHDYNAELDVSFIIPENARADVEQRKTICTMAHLGAGAFGSISGAVVQTTAFVLQEPRHRRDINLCFSDWFNGR